MPLVILVSSSSNARQARLAEHDDNASAAAPATALPRKVRKRSSFPPINLRRPARYRSADAGTP